MKEIEWISVNIEILFEKLNKTFLCVTSIFFNDMIYLTKFNLFDLQARCNIVSKDILNWRNIIKTNIFIWNVINTLLNKTTSKKHK